MRKQTTVVAVDGTDTGWETVRWAAGEARRREQPLRVVHVLDWDWSAARYDDAGRDFETARQHAEGLAAEGARRAHEAEPDLDTEIDVLIGAAGAQLVSESEYADLIVLGNRGHGGFAGLRLGSVSQRVATHARCPVAVVRGSNETGHRPVVAGVDGSGAAEGVLEAAFAAARQRGVILVAIRSYLPSAALPADEQDTLERAVLLDQVAPWRAKYPDVTVETLVAHGGAAAVLVGVSHSAQLVVVGSRGHGVIAGTLLGSTGLQLLHHAECPVLIVRPSAGPS